MLTEHLETDIRADGLPVARATFDSTIFVNTREIPTDPDRLGVSVVPNKSFLMDQIGKILDQSSTIFIRGLHFVYRPSKEHRHVKPEKFICFEFEDLDLGCVLPSPIATKQFGKTEPCAWTSEADIVQKIETRF